MEGLDLVVPTVGLKKSFIEALVEFQAEGLPWKMHLQVDELRRDFASFVATQINKTTFWSKDKPVDETELWAALHGVFVGRISIRHALNADLRLVGGHIGYDTRPSYRGRGIASAMLEQALPIARRIGIREALLTCNDDNVASIRTIEKNGGVLRETKPLPDSGVLKRYYLITL